MNDETIIVHGGQKSPPMGPGREEATDPDPATQAVIRDGATRYHLHTLDEIAGRPMPIRIVEDIPGKWPPRSTNIEPAPYRPNRRARRAAAARKR